MGPPESGSKNRAAALRTSLFWQEKGLVSMGGRPRGGGPLELVAGLPAGSDSEVSNPESVGGCRRPD